MRGPFIIGLTGSIGMGKSTVAGMFKEHGVATWDADAAVSRLYGTGGEAVEAIRNLYPMSYRDGQVDRRALKRWILEDPMALEKIEAVVHPLVAKDRGSFISETSANIVLLDIPLLFEIKMHNCIDITVVVSTTADIQRERVLARAGMSEEMLAAILRRQVPDLEKRAQADIVIDTTNLAPTRTAVQDIVETLTQERSDARDRFRH